MNVWTPERIDKLEASWNEEKESIYDTLRPLLLRCDRVLDAGCGVGIFRDLLVEKADEYVGVDITPEMLRRARRYYPEEEFILGDIRSLDLPSSSFDLVFCWSVLIHLPLNQFSLALKELSRVSSDRILFNFYILDRKTFVQTKGNWGEYIVAMNLKRLNRIFDEMSLRTVLFSYYGGKGKIKGEPFRRAIIKLSKKGI